MKLRNVACVAIFETDEGCSGSVSPAEIREPLVGCAVTVNFQESNYAAYPKFLHSAAVKWLYGAFR